MLQEQMRMMKPAASLCSTGLCSKLAPWAAQINVAGILAQTLFFKFTYAPETQVVFGERGGRLAATAVGLAELE